MVVTKNLTILQGATFEHNFYRKDKKTGQPISLAGVTAKLDIVDEYGGTVILSLTTENGGLTITSNAGKTAVLITDEQSATLTTANAKLYNLEHYNADGTIKRVAQGSITIDLDAKEE